MVHSNEDDQYQATYKKPEHESKKKFNPKQILQGDDRCHKCGDSNYVEGSQYSAQTFQCRHCHNLLGYYLCFDTCYIYSGTAETK